MLTIKRWYLSRWDFPTLTYPKMIMGLVAGGLEHGFYWNPNSCDDDPSWLIFFGVETTNQIFITWRIQTIKCSDPEATSPIVFRWKLKGSDQSRCFSMVSLNFPVPVTHSLVPRLTAAWWSSKQLARRKASDTAAPFSHLSPRWGLNSFLELKSIWNPFGKRKQRRI